MQTLFRVPKRTLNGKRGRLRSSLLQSASRLVDWSATVTVAMSAKREKAFEINSS